VLIIQKANYYFMKTIDTPIHTIKSREIRLASRPQGMPTLENFTLTSVELPELKVNQVLVRNLYMSVDPYMRGRMNDVKSYVPPFQIGQSLQGAAVGEVVESLSDEFKLGDVVTSHYGWREFFISDAKELQKVNANVKPLSTYLGVLGMTGLTAWVGLNLVEVKAGDCIFISAAAGAVGSIAGQLAKLRGCRVIGSAGSSEKVKTLLEEFGFDAAFNYKDGDVLDQLKKAAPDGITVYFDNVGGDHLEAALTVLRPFGRIISCGMISKYNETTPSPGPRNLVLMLVKRLTMKGFIVSDWKDSIPQFLKEVGGYLAGGKLRTKETVIEGIENAPKAFLDLLHGANTGKMIVRLK
jgi:NADPH-dependent curcumin reductase CurA